MKQTITESQFKDAFKSMGRGDNFSYEGLTALYEMLIDFEEGTGEELELDVICLCCEYSEHENALDWAKDYGKAFEGEEEALEYLAENTWIWPFTDGIIVLDF